MTINLTGRNENLLRSIKLPCDTIITVKLEIKNAQIDIMKTTLENKGYTITHQDENTLYFRGSTVWDSGNFNKTTGVVTSRTNMDWLRQAYTQEFIQQKVRRYGWQVKQTGENKFEILKRF